MHDRDDGHMSRLQMGRVTQISPKGIGRRTGQISSGAKVTDTSSFPLKSLIDLTNNTLFIDRLIELLTMFSSVAARSRIFIRGARNVTAKRTMAEMPVPQSSKAVLFEGHAKREGWEGVIAVWYTSSFILICAILGTRPDTTIESWAQQEAIARLAYDGKLEFGTHYQDIAKPQTNGTWDGFSRKTLKFGDDDDDDEEEEEGEEESEEDDDKE